MRNQKSAISFNLSLENSYLKHFQIANQNLSLLQKEELASRLLKRDYHRKKEEHQINK